jgi:hypothetical protein
MRNRVVLAIVMLVTVSVLTTSAVSHIPIVPDDGTTLATATEIIDPWKSWFYYSELNSEEAHYYRFDASAGERIRFILNVPIPEGHRGFTPTFILMGPGITDSGMPDASIEIPSGAGVMVIEPSALEPEYEGFTPLSHYKIVDFNMSAPETGTYFIAIFDDTIGGRYALVTGYVEAYTLIGWISVPLDVMVLLQWSGQSLFFILIPMFLPLILGLVFLFLRHRALFDIENIHTLIGTLGGLMFLGSALSFSAQVVYALTQAPANWTLIPSLIFISLPLILGIVTLRILQSENWETRGNLLILIVLSVIAPFVWAGLYIGPVFLIAGVLISLFKK